MPEKKTHKVAADKPAAAGNKNPHASLTNRGRTEEATGNTPAGQIYYQCQRCCACCQWPGEVKLLPGEEDRIAAFLGLDVREFIETHTRLQSSRRGLSLLEKEDGSCAFLDGRDCRLQPVKPEQCRGFPNTWNFPGWRELCQAIPVQVSDS